MRISVLKEGDAVPELAIATTDHCQARCAHCLMKSGPEREEVLTVREMWRVIEYLVEHNGLRLVVFTGGESTFLGEDLLEIIARCVGNGIGTRLVTNACWAKDVESANNNIKAWREVGLDELNISTDDFHRVWIPLDWVRNAWNSAKGVGFKSVVIGVCYGPRSKVTPDYLQEVLEEHIPLIYDSEGNRMTPGRASDGTLYAISNTPISRIGRASRLRDDYFSRRNSGAVLGPCGGVLRPMTMLANGDIGMCCGINAESNLVLASRETARGTFDVLPGIIAPERELLLSAITTLGPAYLYGLVTQTSPHDIETSFNSMCELCEKFTTNDAFIAAALDMSERITSDVFAARIISGLDRLR